MHCNFAVSVAQLPIHYPTPDVKSLCQWLSEYVVIFYGNEFFTRLDVREQCTCRPFFDPPRYSDLNKSIEINRKLNFFVISL